jgi:hypothetical protein
MGHPCAAAPDERKRVRTAAGSKPNPHRSHAGVCGLEPHGEAATSPGDGVKTQRKIARAPRQCGRANAGSTRPVYAAVVVELHSDALRLKMPFEMRKASRSDAVPVGDTTAVTSHYPAPLGDGFSRVNLRPILEGPAAQEALRRGGRVAHRIPGAIRQAAGLITPGHPEKRACGGGLEPELLSQPIAVGNVQRLQLLRQGRSRSLPFRRRDQPAGRSPHSLSNQTWRTRTGASGLVFEHITNSGRGARQQEDAGKGESACRVSSLDHQGSR